MKQVDVVHKPELICVGCDHSTVEAFMNCTRIRVSMVSGTVKLYHLHIDDLKGACREIR